MTDALTHTIDQLATRHGFSDSAARAMVDALERGNGRMAQFNHPEFGGSGQWMAGGMTMVSDFGNDGLRQRVDALASALSGVLHDLPRRGQGAATSSQRATSSADEGRRVPPEWGHAAASGSQNQMRYDYYPDARRLVVEADGTRTVYDTADHRLQGVSQQQSGSASLTFQSQHGPVDLSQLRRVNAGSPSGESAMPSSPSVQAATNTRDATESPTQTQAQSSSAGPQAGGGAAVQLIEELARLHQKGILSDAEYQAKKRELLGRL